MTPVPKVDAKVDTVSLEIIRISWSGREHLNLRPLAPHGQWVV
jgi:hypothetical protein